MHGYEEDSGSFEMKDEMETSFLIVAPTASSVLDGSWLLENTYSYINRDSIDVHLAFRIRRRIYFSFLGHRQIDR